MLADVNHTASESASATLNTYVHRALVAIGDEGFLIGLFLRVQYQYRGVEHRAAAPPVSRPGRAGTARGRARERGGIDVPYRAVGSFRARAEGEGEIMVPRRDSH